MAITVCFVVHGAVLASWTPRIPTVKAQLQLSDGTLGLVLLGLPVGALIAMPLTGALSSRIGSRPVTRLGLVLYCSAPVLIGSARSGAALAAALFVWGLGVGAVEVAINVQASAVERIYGRPIMSTFHGGWSIGALIGSLVGSLLAAHRVELTLSLGGVGAAGLLLAALVMPWLSPARAEKGHAFARPSRALLALGAVAFASYMAEGAVADWSAVYLRDSLEAAAGVAGLGYAVFTFSMTVGRLSGGRLAGRVGARRVVRVAAMTGAGALAAALAIGSLPLAVVGFGVFGLGLCIVVPSSLTAAVERSGATGTSAALAAVSTCGIAGYLIGPPIIGGLASGISLPAALGLLPVLALAIALLAGGLSGTRPLGPAAEPGPAGSLTASGEEQP